MEGIETMPHIEKSETMEFLHQKARELSEGKDSNRELFVAMKDFVINDIASRPEGQQCSPKTIIESRFTPADEAFEKGMWSCGTVSTMVAEMLRSIGKKVRFIHGEHSRSVDHSWLSVFNESSGEWEEFDTARNNLNIRPDYVKKAEVDSWEEIKDQIYSDEETLRERRKAKGYYGQ
ncbi:MAG TPA: transglutaminase domain-containing protein [Candidatus Paceibacterota bacterium]|jgi:hypothetical protein|nr:transglutaminase domain-containing protein [Candidatus Paceibacterota bacterium]